MQKNVKKTPKKYLKKFVLKIMYSKYSFGESTETVESQATVTKSATMSE